MVIKRFGPVSCAKVSGTLYAVLGLVLGALFSLMSLAGGLASDAGGGAMAAMIGVGAVVVFPVLYGCIGFVATLIGAWLYNVIAGFLGGIEVDLQ